MHINRRQFLTLSAAIAAAGALPKAAWSAAPELRIGYQKSGSLTFLKARGTLEPLLEQQGVAVRWIEFPAGPQLLEGLNVGSVDFGTTGEAPPIFAQAANANLLYVGYEPPTPLAEALIVPKDSPLQTVAELKGKQVALNKGSNVHYLLVRALEKAGLRYSDIKPVFLPPADARAAFERGSVDAWAIWDPFYAAAELQLGARRLVDGQGLVANHNFYLAARPYAEQNPAVLKTTLQAIAEVGAWVVANPVEAAGILAQQTGLAAQIIEHGIRRSDYGVQPINAQVAAEQQKIADVFHELKLIPKPIRIADALWQA